MCLSVTLELTMNMTSGSGANPGCPTLLPEMSQRLKAEQKEGLVSCPKKVFPPIKNLKHAFCIFNHLD